MVDNDDFKKNSSCSLVFLNMHKLIHDMIISWNFTCDMIERVCQQQLPDSSVVLQYWDALIYLELLSNEWTILEDILKLLKAFKIETAHLCGEKFPINSAFRPLLQIIIQEDDVSAINVFKNTLQKDMKY